MIFLVLSGGETGFQKGWGIRVTVKCLIAAHLRTHPHFLPLHKIWGSSKSGKGGGGHLKVCYSYKSVLFFIAGPNHYDRLHWNWRYADPRPGFRMGGSVCVTTKLCRQPHSLHHVCLRLFRVSSRIYPLPDVARGACKKAYHVIIVYSPPKLKIIVGSKNFWRIIVKFLVLPPAAGILY